MPAVLAAVRELAPLRHPTRPGRGPGLQPGRCRSKAHDRENLGLGGRRVLVSRQWSGKTLDRAPSRPGDSGPRSPARGRDARPGDRTDGRHRALRRTGKPRFVWTDTRPDRHTYIRVVLASIAERQRWRAQYQAAQEPPSACGQPFGNLDQPRDRAPLTAHLLGLPDDQPKPWSEDRLSRVSGANPQDTKCP